MYVVTVLPMPEIIDLILCLDHKNLNVSLAVYFAVLMCLLPGQSTPLVWPSFYSSELL